MTEPLPIVYRPALNERVEPGGSVTYLDADGNARQVAGTQPDGTITTVDQNGPPPPAPTAPAVVPAKLGLVVSWDGTLASTTPADFDHVEVHLSDTSGFTPDNTTLRGTMNHPGGFQVAPLTAGTTYYAALVGVNTSGVSGGPSAEASADPAQIDQADLSFHVGGTTVTYGSTAPSDPATGDFWYDTTDPDHIVMKRWTGTAWAAVSFDAGSLLQAEAIVAGLLAAESVVAENLAAVLVLATIIIAGTPSGARVQLDGTVGIGVYDASGAQRGQFGADGSLWLDGDYLSATEMFAASLEINAGVNQGFFVYGQDGSALNTNPSFATGISGWGSVGGSTLAYSGDHTYLGHNVLKATLAGGVAGAVNTDTTITPGVLYQLHTALLGPANSRTYCAIDWKNSSGVVIKTDTSGPQIMDGSSFEDTYAQGVAPVGAAKAAVRVGFTSNYVGSVYAGVAELFLTNTALSFAPVAGTDKYGNPYPAGLSTAAAHITSLTAGNLACGILAQSTSAAGRVTLTNPFNSAIAHFVGNIGDDNTLYAAKLVSVSSTAVTWQIRRTDTGAAAASGQAVNINYIGMLAIA